MKRLTDNIRNLIDLTAEAPGLEPLAPYSGPLAPEPRPPAHDRGCWCVRCWNSGLDYGEYLHQKKMNEL